MRIVIKVMLLVFLGIGPAAAQAVDTAGTVEITGQVINEATGEPLPNAKVALRDWGDYAVRTDPAGRFLFPVATPGRRTLVAQHAGYLVEERPVDVQCESRAITVVGSPPLKCPVPPQPMVIRMRPARSLNVRPGLLRGRIVDEGTGRGLANVLVFVGGVPGAFSNSDGVYSVRLSEPAVYWVEVHSLGHRSERRLIVVMCQDDIVPCKPTGAELGFWMRAVPIQLN